MTRIELFPDLTHCVETRAKQEYAATMQRILSGDRAVAVEERLELLRAFLETADFTRLRRESEEHLVQGRKVKLVLSGSAGRAIWTLQVIEGN